ncbi:hypothetical protein C1H46_025997 [Malus baccata]|uniref:Amine oxidase domain-containing protein n=1 Tax=Malus baccata TaxID=106549 RepID=A0A540LPR8_MALBA|nr:hypothetical protein C1H46_025997 [Malus baccata]
MDPKDRFSADFFDGSVLSHIERQQNVCPSVIVIGGGISGIAASRILHDASFKVVLLESRDRLGGRIHTDYSFGCPVDMGASWLHGVCNENPLAPLIRRLGLTLYRTSGDDSVLYDHDLESFALFDMDGRQVPQKMVVEVGDTFKKILKGTEKVRIENSDDMSVCQAISVVMDRHPELRQKGLAHEVLQWYICRMEAWFAADADVISLKNWDQGATSYKNLCFLSSQKVTKILYGSNTVMVTIEDGRNFIADAAIITVPHGILKANLIEFEPQLPEWKVAAISDLGVGNENKIALRFEKVFWPNVELLGIVAPNSYGCGYFLNLHKVTGHPVLVYMAAGRFAYDLEKLTDDAAVNFVMLQLKKMMSDATEPIQYLVSRWGTDVNSLGCYALDLVGKPGNIYERLRAPLGNLFFGGEAVSMDHQGSVHGAYSAGVMAAENCQRHLLQELGSLETRQHAYLRDEVLEGTVPIQISRM